jgi:hypothetical protein
MELILDNRGWQKNTGTKEIFLFLVQCDLVGYSYRI